MCDVLEECVVCWSDRKGRWTVVGSQASKEKKMKGEVPGANPTTKYVLATVIGHRAAMIGSVHGSVFGLHASRCIRGVPVLVVHASIFNPV